LDRFFRCIARTLALGRNLHRMRPTKSDNWYGVVAPARTPPDILKEIPAASVAALKDPALTNAFAKQSATASATSPEEFATFVRDEQAK
jgi:tripartite-type tricarboxylate transporter receptor subunit TctC